MLLEGEAGTQFQAGFVGQMEAGIISVNFLNLPNSMGQDAHGYPGQKKSLRVDREALWPA